MEYDSIKATVSPPTTTTTTTTTAAWAFALEVIGEWEGGRRGLFLKKILFS